MRIESVEVFHVQLVMTEPFTTSFGTIEVRDLLILRAETDVGVSWSELPVLRTPSYTAETIFTSLHILVDFMLPAVIGKEFSDVDDLLDLVGSIRGNNATRYAIDSLGYHMLSSKLGASVSEIIGGTNAQVACGVSVGIYSDSAQMLEFIEKCLQEGFLRIKLKIKPGHDVEILDIVRKRFPSVLIMVDANGAYSRDDLHHLEQFEKYNLLMMEQPFGYEDLVTHAQLQKRVSFPVCLDESVASSADFESALELGACRALNVKLSRIGGFHEALRIHKLAKDANIALWCGGVMESGIGQADGLALSSLSTFTFPADIGPSDRYFKRDVVPNLGKLVNGTMLVSSTPGVGFDIDEDFIRGIARSRWNFPRSAESWTIS